jgi:3-hydroxyacyl-CoA dehydrogenase
MASVRVLNTQRRMTVRNVVVLGNGTMGSGAAAVFAAAGLHTHLLARTRDKADAGRMRADQLAKGAAAQHLTAGTYDTDLIGALEDADLVFETLAEDLELKRGVFELIDRMRNPDTIVATVTSGLPIRALCADRSDGFRRHFLGIHLFNPPTAIKGCELIAHPGTDNGVVARARAVLAKIGREIVEAADTPAFAGNRVGFKVLNEVAQLAEEYGVAFMDRLLGGHTGRALPPLATIDLVGWDVHKAIIDNLWANTDDEAHDSFRLPAYIQRGIERGHLGRKTKDKGGFFRLDGKTKLALDPVTGDYQKIAEGPPPEVAAQMTAAGDHLAAMAVLASATGHEAEVLRRVMLGYISYALARVGEVVEHVRDIDRIMAFGFHWAPPGLLVDAIGARRTIELLDALALPVPPVVVDAARLDVPLYREPGDSGRFFVVAA